MHNLGITKYIRGGYNAFSRTVLFDYWTCLLFYRLTGKSIRDHVKRLRDGSVRSVVQPACAKDVKENQSALHWVKWCSGLKSLLPHCRISSPTNLTLLLMLYVGNLSLLAEMPVEFQLKLLSQLHPLLHFPLFIHFIARSCCLLSAETPSKHRGAPLLGHAGLSRPGTGFNPKKFAAGNVDKVNVTGVTRSTRISPADPNGSTV